MSGNSLDGLFVTIGADLSPFAKGMIQAEYIASGSSAKIKEKILSIATSMGALRKESTQVKEALANAADFRVRGDAALDKLHQQLDGVRAAGNATGKTLDELSLGFEAASKGGNSYVQALNKVASDKNASTQVKQLAAELRDQAKEANLAIKELEKYEATLNRQINRQRRTFTSSLRQAEKQQNQHQVPQYAAASAAARLLEGQTSIRAGERFLTSTLGLGSFLQGVFPVVGGLAALGMLDELYDRAQRAYQALKKIEEAPQRIGDEFRSLNGSAALTNDELRVTNDRLANEIAQLEGKPQNTLKLALDEARVAADKLSESLRKDLTDLNKLLAEENVGFFARLLGNAGTGDIKKEFGGDSGLGGFYERVNDISYAGNERIRSATTAQEKDKAQADLTGRLQAAYRQELARINAELADAEKLQKQRNTPRPSLPVTPFGITPGAPRVEQLPGGQDQSARIELLKGVRSSLSNQIDYLGLNQQNLALTGEKDKLNAGKAADAVTRPYQDKIRELGAQLEGLNAQLTSIGQSETAETLAKSWAKAQEEITRLNDELAKHHQALSLDQQVQLVTLSDLEASTQAEIAWKTKLDQTTDSIQNRIASLKLLADAMGKGAAAQHAAAVESQVMQTLGSKYNDPEWMRTHQGDVLELRRQFGAQDDATRANQSQQSVQQLTEQIQLERSLAAAQSQGAEAIRLVTLAYKLRELAATGATAAQIQAEIDLANAQKQNKSAGALASLAEELKATQMLSAAQLQGADAYRKAQNELKYEQMARQGASPEEVQQTRIVDAAKHQSDVTAAALQTGLHYQNQLDSLDEQIAALQQLKATQGDSLAIEESLKTLEQERAHLFTQQVSIVGTARDGLHAYFQEMATQGVSSAQEVHDVFKKAFDGLNDSLAKMVTGQRVSWASFFSGIAEQLAKISLNNLEAKLGSVLAPKTGSSGGQAQSSSGAAGILQSLGGLFSRSFGGFRAEGGDVDAGNIHVVGEEGPELFVPDSDGTIIPADKTKQVLAQKKQSGAAAPTPATNLLPSLNKQADANALANAVSSEPSDPQAFDKTGSASKISNVSLATQSPSFLSVLMGAAGAGLSGGLRSMGQPGQPAAGAALQNDGPPDIGPQPPEDPLGQLPWNHDLPAASKFNWWNTRAGKATSTFGALGISAGFGLLAKLLSQAHDHHFRPGNAYAIPNFNGAYAEGGKVKKGMAHLVGEDGKELFIPKLPPAVKLRDTVPFGGYRATGGNVDPNYAYMVGEEGPEMWTPPSAGGTIVPNHALASGSGLGDTYIDARGTDPAATEQSIRRANAATHKSSVYTSFRSYVEYQKRTPEAIK